MKNQNIQNARFVSENGNGKLNKVLTHVVESLVPLNFFDLLEKRTAYAFTYDGDFILEPAKSGRFTSPDGITVSVKDLDGKEIGKFNMQYTN